MNPSIRTSAVAIIILASLCGCRAVQPVTSSIANLADRIIHPNKTGAAAAQPSPALDAYKASVAYHVMRRNPAHTFSGKLPEMLPAIVVLNITVNKDGELKDVEVQRSRDPDASRVAVDSMRRSGPLPKPARLMAKNSNSLTFSETFLFNADYRFQLRSVAGPQ